MYRTQPLIDAMRLIVRKGPNAGPNLNKTCIVWLSSPTVRFPEGYSELCQTSKMK